MFRPCFLLLILTTLHHSSSAANDFSVYNTQAEQQIAVTLTYWIFFTDKGFASQKAEAEAINKLAETLPKTTLRRRALRSELDNNKTGLLTMEDLPLHGPYIEEISKFVQRIRVKSRWLNAVSAELSPDALTRIGALPFVSHFQEVARARRPLKTGEWQKMSGPQQEQGNKSKQGTTIDYGMSAPQISQIGLDQLHQRGYTGAGVVIAVLDSGFTTTHETFNQGGHELQLLNQYDFVNDDPNPDLEPGDPTNAISHGTRVLSVIGSYLPGTLVGGAFDAAFILCKSEDIAGEYQQEEDFYVAALEFSEFNGADIVTSSLSYYDWYTEADYDGVTAVTTIAVNALTQRGVFAVTSAGNRGHDTNPAVSHMAAPADAFDVLTIGAVDGAGGIASFSSDGPTADGRVKPEILARGLSVPVVDPFDDTGYGNSNGTSFSCPLVAAALACLIQAHPNWSVTRMRQAMLFSAADYIQNRETDPFFIRGFGILNSFATLQDCNGNCIPDLDEITDGSLADSDGNGIADICDGLTADIDGNFAVDLFDLRFALPSWIQSTANDLNLDGKTNILDLASLPGLFDTCP